MKNKSAQELGRLSAQKRDTSSEAMRALAKKRWQKGKTLNETKTESVKNSIFGPEGRDTLA